MKRLFAIVMVVLTVLSVGGVTLYSIHKSVADGGQPPEILFDKDQIDVAANAGDEELLQGVTALDKEDGDVTDSLMVETVSRFVEKDTVTVTYVAYDSQRHVARSSRSVHYTDYTPPRFTMSGPMLFVEKNVSDMLDSVGARDKIDGDISLKVHASFEDTASALSSVGTHTVTLSVTNSLGDTVRLDVPVKVVEDSPRSDSIPLKTYLVYLKHGDAFDPRSYLADEDQAKAQAGGTEDRAEDNPLRISSGVNTAAPGVYTVDYALVRNETTTAQTRLIVVVE